MTSSNSLSNAFKNIFLCLFCLLAFPITCYGGDYDPIALYLTWQRSPESTMTICWLTAVDREDDLIEYRRTEDLDWMQSKGSHNQLPGDAPYILHMVELTHLQSETDYSFRTGQDAKIYKFQTMPATLHDSIRFVAGGDMYHDDIEFLRETNQQAAKTSPQFALVGGDISYSADKAARFIPNWTKPWLSKLVTQKFKRWLAWLVAWKEDMVTPEGRLIPLLPVIGNHDVNGAFEQPPEQAPYFYALFPMPGPQGYNVLDFGSYMSIFLLDSDHTHPIGGKQTQWLANALKEREKVPNKFALYHVPAYPSARPMNYEVSTKIRKNWTPLFDKYHLTAAFENHEHDYKRSHPILNGRIAPDGVMYFGDGAWGVEKPRKPSQLTKKWYLARTAAARHFLFVVVEPQRKYVAGISSDGDLIDEYAW